MNIRSKLLAIFIPLVVISIGLGGALNISHFKTLSRESKKVTDRIHALRDSADKAAGEISSIMDSRTLADFTFISRQLKNGFEAHMSNLAKMLDIIARSRLVHIYINQPDKRPEFTPELQDFLRTAISDYNLLGAALVDADGRILFRETSKIIPDDGTAPLDAAAFIPGDDLSETKWFDSRLKEQKFMHLLADMKDFGTLGPTPVADLSCPLKFSEGRYAPYTGTTKGYLLLSVNVRELTRSILIPRADFHWHLFLTDSDNRILVSTDPKSIGKEYDLSIEQKKTNYAITQKIFRGKLAFHLLTSKAQFEAGSRIINDLSGSIAGEAAAVSQLSQVIDESISASIKQVVMITAVALLAAILVIVITAGRISRSLGRLAESANRIAAGDLELSPTGVPAASAEIAELTRNLDHMRSNLKAQIENLNKAEKKFRDIFENAMEGIFQATPDGRFISANPALAGILGYPSADMLVQLRSNSGKLLFAEPETFDRFRKILKRLGRIANFIAQFKRRDGAVFWGTVSARWVADPSGDYIEGTMEDITKRKSAEEASRKFKFIADASKDFMTLINRDYVYEAVNKSYCEQRGLPEYKIVGRTVADIWGETLFQREIKPYMDRCFQGEFLDYEAPISFHKEEKKFFHVFYSPYRDDRNEVTHAVVVSRNISRRKKAEALKREKLAAEAASKAKSEFLASMSHEIRTPMTAILGMTELLSDSRLSEQDREYVRIVRGAGENLLDLINDILDLSKVEAGKLELENIPFDLRSMLKDTVDFMAFRAGEKGLKLKYTVSEQVPQRVIGDPTRIRQIIVNLTGNAVKFTEQGEIEITVDARYPNGNGTVELLFGVRDTGIGIPEDKRDTVFESYSQQDSSTTRRYGGTGLGLTICRRLTSMMGGQIWVEEAPGGGSLFRFTCRVLKADDIPLQVEAAPAPDHEEDKNRALRILLAEDNDNNRMLFHFYLKKTDHVVEEAVNGREAVEKFREGEYDIVFMDIEMPEMDGYDATRAIREWEGSSGKNPVPVITLTAHALTGVDKKSADAGCTGHMTKPFKKKDLLAALERYV